MTLAELKTLLGVLEEDTSRDAYLELMLESALLAAQAYCDKLDFLTLIDAETGQIVLPAPVKLGMVEWVRANEEQTARGNVVSESIGGLSQSFGDAGAAYSGAYAHWEPYHNAVRFLPVGRRYGR